MGGLKTHCVSTPGLFLFGHFLYAEALPGNFFIFFLDNNEANKKIYHQRFARKCDVRGGILYQILFYFCLVVVFRR